MVQQPNVYPIPRAGQIREAKGIYSKKHIVMTDLLIHAITKENRWNAYTYVKTPRLVKLQRFWSTVKSIKVKFFGQKDTAGFFIIPTITVGSYAPKNLNFGVHFLCWHGNVGFFIF